MCAGGMSEPRLARRPLRPTEASVDRDRLGRGGQVHDRLGDGELSLRGAEPLVGLPGRQRYLQGPGVGHSHVLAGEAHEPSHHVQRILATAQHPRQPVQGGVRVGAAHRLVEG